MNILFTGGNGQLAQDSFAVLSDLGEICGIARPDFNLTDRKGCCDILNVFTPDVIVNCAAHTGVDACESDPSYWPINAEGPGLLEDWTERNGSHPVHISTDYVFVGSVHRSNYPCLSTAGKQTISGKAT